MKHSFPKIYHFIDDFKEKDIEYLPNNIALIYRNYEKKPSKLLITKIRSYCRKRKIKFYLANNYKMALKLNLDGIYLPSFNKQIIFNIFSISFIIISISLLLFKGLNYGVDFKGGTLIELRATDNQITISQLRQSFLNMNLGDVSVKEFGKNTIF